jgi:hypothetical protein
MKEALIARQPMGRLVTADEIAHAILFANMIAENVVFAVSAVSIDRDGWLPN